MRRLLGSEQHEPFRQHRREAARELLGRNGGRHPDVQQLSFTDGTDGQRCAEGDPRVRREALRVRERQPRAPQAALPRAHQIEVRDVAQHYPPCGTSRAIAAAVRQSLVPRVRRISRTIASAMLTTRRCEAHIHQDRSAHTVRQAPKSTMRGQLTGSPTQGEVAKTVAAAKSPAKADATAPWARP